MTSRAEYVREWKRRRKMGMPTRGLARELGGGGTAYRTATAAEPFGAQAAGIHVVPTRVPQWVEADRHAHIVASSRSSLTAVLMGDPPPGFSALERRGGAR